jgi:nucleotide-binding universal stress UspA family protein
MRMQFKRIVCATDFSDFSNRTVNYGIKLAKEFGSKIYVCHVIDLSSVAIYGEFQLDPVGLQNRVMKDASEQLEELIGKQHKEWEPLITVGHAADEISRIVEEKDIDLVVAATRGRSGLKRLILGSVTERLMRTLTCPLLVVHSPGKEFISPDDQELKIENILVGCDFSPDAGLAFEYGLSLAQEFQSELHLAHVIEASIYQELHKTETPIEEELQQEIHNRLLQKLQDMVPEEARNWCTPQTSLLDGHPYEELVKYAEQHNIGIIVLGTRGHGLVKSLFVGSTTDRVVRRAPCPVLSVSTKIQNG